MITELWTVYGASDEPLNVEYFTRHDDVEVPDDEAQGGVKQVTLEVHAYGDTTPPGAYVQVTATSHERAIEVWHNVVRHLNLTAWWTHKEVVSPATDDVPEPQPR